MGVECETVAFNPLPIQHLNQQLDDGLAPCQCHVTGHPATTTTSTSREEHERAASSNTSTNVGTKDRAARGGAPTRADKSKCFFLI